MEEVKNRRIKDGQYEFSYKGQTILANREPDLYFIIELGGQRLKGYLKDLKVKYAQYIDGGAPTSPPEAQGGAAGATEVVAARPAKPLKVAREKVAEEEELGYGIREQERIDACTDRQEQIHRWVMAYNIETASLHVGYGKRNLETPGFIFVLPPGAPPKPPLVKCYNAKADRYVWPRMFCDQD